MQNTPHRAQGEEMPADLNASILKLSQAVKDLKKVD